MFSTSFALPRSNKNTWKMMMNTKSSCQQQQKQYKSSMMMVVVSMMIVATTFVLLVGGVNSSNTPSSTLPSSMKIWIYFNNKGIDEKNSRSSLHLPSIIDGRITKLKSLASESLEKHFPTSVPISEKALARRRKVVQESISLKRDVSGEELSLYSIHDVPIVEEYVQKIVNMLRQDQKIGARSNWLNAITVSDVTQEQIEKIQKLAFVDRIERVATFKRSNLEERNQKVVNTRHVADDSSYGVAFNQLNQVNVVATRNMYPELNGTGITILVCDSGFHLQHKALKSIHITGQYDFVNKDTNTDNESGEAATTSNHGTQCLSAIAGYDLGNFMGPAPGASVLLAKTEDVRTETQVEEDNFIEAIEWGERLGADIVSASLGYTDWYSHSKKEFNGVTSPLTRVVNIASRYKGLIMVLAAGNEGAGGSNTIGTPSDGFDVISVGSVDVNGKISYFSSRGPSDDGRTKPEVSARGSSTYLVSPNTDSDYLTSSGTSFATPIVAGCVALILQKNPTWTPYQMRKAVMMTASKNTEPGNDLGWGIVNTLDAMRYIQSNSSFESTFNDSPTSCPATTNLGPVYNSECGWKANRGVCFNGECRCYLSSTSSCDIPSSASSITLKCGLHNCKSGICSKDECQCFYGWAGIDCSTQGNLSNTLSVSIYGLMFIVLLLTLL
ncbi:subtilisin-like serine protease [Naegleria gruberi]|uniref:Subtilisin-like serine protease n=1 Tax=Naegleria gruberi TaxID=5762 RepID=D2W315_NAEGR|nr:subtilisin-like serine protease [Naegleria gruberi]EFC36534.1 subtilisin-like serine protease [Naegleria gruberi]|eukprot:XP_002669278.1 subtilisin-like serine protease [Naegleria gruberi strain NEG-M]